MVAGAACERQGRRRADGGTALCPAAAPAAATAPAAAAAAATAVVVGQLQRSHTSAL